MTSSDLGNRLNAIVWQSRASLFDQGEVAELTYGAFNVTVAQIRATEQDEWNVSFPVGYKPDRTTIQGQRKYTKDQLIAKYEYLAVRQLSVNAVVQLVTIVDAMLTDVVRAVVMRYPQKLGAKRQVSVQSILESSSLEEVHLRATDALINELSYKSPSEFAEHFRDLVGINLLECPSYHWYIEIKAARDIFIHNNGVANAIYARKAGSHARVTPGFLLPSDVLYLLESYEHCLTVADWVEGQLHMHWHSTEFEKRQQQQLSLPLTPPNEPSPSDPDAGA